MIIPTDSQSFFPTNTMTNLLNKKINPYIKSSFIYLLATALGQGISFIGIIVFTRIMPKAEYGEYSTYYAYVSILTTLTGGNIYLALNNAYIEHPSEIREFRKSALGLSVAVMMAVSSVALTINAYFYRQFDIKIAIACLFHAYAFFVITYRTYSANMENDYKKKTVLLTVPYVLQFLIALVFVLACENYTFQARVYGGALGVIVIAIPCFVEVIKNDGRLIDIKYWRYAAGIAFPSVIMSLSYMLMQHCDRIMIRFFCGAEETAGYSAIYYIGYVIIAINAALNPVRMAWLYKRMDAEKCKEIRRIQKWYILIIIFAASILALLGREIISLVFSEEYWDFEYILPFVLGALMMVLYGFYSDVLLYYKKNLLLSLVTLFAAIINIALNGIFVPQYGPIAACYTTLVAYTIIYILTAWLSNRIIKIYSKKYFAGCFVWMMLVTITVFCSGDLPLYRYLALGVILVTLLIYLHKDKEGLLEVVCMKDK